MGFQGSWGNANKKNTFNRKISHEEIFKFNANKKVILTFIWYICTLFTYVNLTYFMYI